MERQNFMGTFFFKKRHDLNFEDFDQFVEEDLKKAKDKAKKLLGVDAMFVNEFNPIIVSTPLPTTKTIEPIYIYGEDRMRYDLAQFAALYFSKDVMFYYKSVIDHKTGANFNDKVVEIPYKRIKTINTSSRFAQVNNLNHHIFEIEIVLDCLDNIVIPLRILLVDETTPKDEYLISNNILEIASNLKSFLRTKLSC